MNKEIFIKYLNNSCSDTELSEFLTCLYSGSADENLMELCKSEWQAIFENPEEPDFDRTEIIFGKILNKINSRNNSNVDFINEDENLKSPANSANIKNESLNQIINLMKGCTPIEDKILQSEKSDEGTFSKQQIVIQQNM